MTYQNLDRKTREGYEDLDEISKRYPLIFDGDGVLRFQQNRAVRFAADVLTHEEHGRNLNCMWIQAQREHWPMEDLRQFYREMGYSLCGFMDIFSGKGNTA